MEQDRTPVAATPSAIAAAAEALRQGRLVAFPTETVYGLGADARSPSAVAGIFAAKRRPAKNPLIVHVLDRDGLEAVAAIPAAARGRIERLTAAFWPGPLTLVLPLRPGAVAPAVTAGAETVAVRAPAHSVARALLAAFGGPIAAPSANPSGRLSPTDAAAVLDGLGDRVDLVLDGGPTAVGVESTILDPISDPPRLLRPGGAPREAIEAALGALVRDAADAPEPDRPTAPGQLASHYAPGAALRLDARDGPRPGEAWLGFGPEPAAAAAAVARASLSEAGDLAEAARRLFAALRRLDAALAGAGVIAVAPIPGHGLGAAIRDRLARAAAPRPSARN